MTLPQAFELALQHHQAGRLAEAEALYRQILAVQPNHADALHHLGLIARQVGRPDLAIEWIRKALSINPNNFTAHCNLAEASRALGRHEEAVASYCRAIDLQPDSAGAYLNMGNILREWGRPDEAVAAYRRALAQKPNYFEACNNLGNVLREQGQLDEAAGAYRQALALQPGIPELHNNLGVTLRDRSQFGEAVAAYRRALELRPDFPVAWYNLGIALRDQGQIDESVAAYRHALKLKPDYPEALNNLGAVLAHQGRLDEAIAHYGRALELKRDFPDAQNNLGNALRERGQFVEAEAVYRRALELNPGFAEAHNNLGAVLAEQGRFDDALAAYRRALELNPNSADAYNNIGAAFAEQRQFDGAVDACRRAIELKHDFPAAHSNLGSALKSLGQLDGAMAAFRDAIHFSPQFAAAHSNLVFAMHFHPGCSARDIAGECARWERQHAALPGASLRPHGNDRTPDRRLKIGWVSSNFYFQSECYFVVPLFEAQDHRGFEIHAYSDAGRPDSITERLKKCVDVWHETRGYSDAQLAERIREDQIDVLVDLDMHMGRNRLPVFARQPAPVQVSWLAYPGSTGLSSIGYRLTDAYMEPPGEKSVWSPEEPVRLPDCWCCYDPITESPDINELPALSASAVTFGSLNNFAKMHDGVLARWARVLAAVKGSRLVMLCPEGRTRERVLEFFGARGIEAGRVELLGYLSRWEYFRLYQRIDLGLDPFPYNGITTTCDSLWMGVPVLTLPGGLPASRAGLSLLSTVGLQEFVASSEDDYVRLAMELAGNLPRLAELRAALRPRMQASPLMDAPRFARNVEAAFRKIWERWRHSHSRLRKD